MPASAATASGRPVARLRTPGELAAVVPLLCGFVPQESLVLISLRGARRQVGVTMRVDLPPPDAAGALVADVVDRLVVDGAQSAAVVVHTEAPDDVGLPRAALVERLTTALTGAGIRPGDRLLVRGGRWWSYGCRSPRCCPPGGTPLAAEPSPAVGLVAASGALDGRAVLPSRAELVASLAAPTDAGVRERLVDAEAAWRRRVAVDGRVACGRAALALWRQATAEALDAPRPDDARAAVLVASLTDVLVRDEVLTWVLDDDGRLLALLLRLAALSATPFDVPVCGLVAWVAHVRGDGGLANVALDRALAADPGYAMARMCREALDAQVPPSAVRAILTEARTALHTQHPWTCRPR